MPDFGMTIGGRQVAGQDSFAVLNPATRVVVSTAANASKDDLDQAVSAAKAAYPAWSALQHADRHKAVGTLAKHALQGGAMQ
jgi:acyl-CoA reductase-like NAD-dependent aldehyde dehydrogenase